MATLTGLTKGGLTWEPKFVQEINYETCLGCGRCYKVCGRNVLMLQPMNEFGEFIDEDDDDDIERQVMTIANPEKFVGQSVNTHDTPSH